MFSREDVGGILNAEAEARAVIQQRLAEADLDAFLVAFFLSRYEREVRHAQILSSKIQELSHGFRFTRSNVAMLGICLSQGWIAATDDSVRAFVDGIKQLERQRPHVDERLRPGLDYRHSLKLLWGLALGASCPAVKSQSIELRDAIATVVRDYRSGTNVRARDYVVATALLSYLEPEGLGALATDLTYYLLRLDANRLSNPDALAALWALKQNCFALQIFGLPTASTKDLEEELEKRLFSLSQYDDVIDALIADWLLGDARAALANGTRLAQDALSTTLRTLDAFAELVRRLRNRRKGHQPLEMLDEYDVQDLLYVALKPHIPDLSDEEWTPKDAGGAKKIDFLSPSARLGVEVKKTRDSEHANKSVPDELKVDIESYHRIERCNNLVVFIYDPDHYTVDPRMMEDHLSGPRVIKGHRVEVIARIRS